MDRRERYNDLNTTILAALQGWQTAIWTALPAKIISFDPGKRTVVAQPLIQGRIQNKDGSYKWVDLPLLLDVPVQFPSGGGFTLTFPIKADDEALVVFASRCIDAWWQQGNASPQPQLELRMHDLSDGFAIVGISSVPNVIDNISTDTVQLRSDDGQMFVELADNHAMNLTTPGKLTINAGGGMEINANITHNGDTTHIGDTTQTGDVDQSGSYTQTDGDFTSEGISAQHHTHPQEGVVPGHTGEPDAV